MKPFVFKKFTIQQSEEVFKIGTDAIVCGSMMHGAEKSKILEIGTGTGIITLMIAQRFPKAQIISLEPHKPSHKLALKNITSSPFSHQITLINNSLQVYENDEKYDVIVSNPPYFHSEKYTHSLHDFARNQAQLSFENIFEFAAKSLSQHGTLQLIYPFNVEDKLINSAYDYNLYPSSSFHIQGNRNTPIVRSFTTWSRVAQNHEINNFIIEEQRGVFTKEYQTLTQDFHPMF